MDWINRPYVSTANGMQDPACHLGPLETTCGSMQQGLLYQLGDMHDLPKIAGQRGNVMVR